MIGHLAHDHMRQQTGARGALLDWLCRLARDFHRACASVLLAGVFDHLHLRRDIFVALADFFADAPQILVAVGAMLVLLGQVMHDALPLQVRRQGPTPARLALVTLTAGRRRRIVLAILIVFFVWDFGTRF